MRRRPRGSCPSCMRRVPTCPVQGASAKAPQRPPCIARKHPRLATGACRPPAASGATRVLRPPGAGRALQASPCTGDLGPSGPLAAVGSAHPAAMQQPGGGPPAGAQTHEPPAVAGGTRDLEPGRLWGSQGPVVGLVLPRAGPAAAGGRGLKPAGVAPLHAILPPLAVCGACGSHADLYLCCRLVKAADRTAAGVRC